MVLVSQINTGVVWHFITLTLCNKITLRFTISSSFIRGNINKQELEAALINIFINCKSHKAFYPLPPLALLAVFRISDKLSVTICPHQMAHRLN